MTILQWTPPQPPSGLGEGKCPYDHCTAETPFGKFLITWKSWNPCDLPTVDETPWGDWFGAFDDVEAAQQACEDEYRKRLQAALAQPSPEGELTDEELAAIAADRARRPAPEPPAEGEVAELVSARLRHCPTHGQQPANAWGCPECVRELRSQLKAPAQGEVAELVAWMKSQVTVHQVAQTQWAKRFVRAAELLQRQHLQPVPVSERLPGPEDCLPWPDEPDATHWCWFGSGADGSWSWEQRSAGGRMYHHRLYTHWLPAHALPLPSAEHS